MEKRSIPAERLCAEEAYQVILSCMEQRLPSIPVVTESSSADDFIEDKMKFMHRAIELSAIGAREGGLPFGVVVVKDGNIVGDGHSLYSKAVI